MGYLSRAISPAARAATGSGECYNEEAGRPLLTGMLIAHQTFGDMLRAAPPWNSHFHAIVLEGGFDDEGTFFYVPFSGLQSLVQVFRRRVIKLLVDRKLLNQQFPRNLLSWRHSTIRPVCIANEGPVG